MPKRSPTPAIPPPTPMPPDPETAESRLAKSHAPTTPKEPKPPKIERTTLPLAKLIPSPYNPRKISDDSKAGLRASIDKFGLVQEIVVNRRTMHIVGGEQRASVLRERGDVDVPVTLVDLSDDEEKALNVTLNNPHIQGEFDGDLGKLLGDVDKALLTGLRTDELVSSLAEKIEEADQDFKRDFDLEDMKVAPPPKMVWSLVAVPTERWSEVAGLIEQIGKVKGVILDTVVR